MAVFANTLAQSAHELIIAPASDASVPVGGDVGSVHGPEWELERAAASVGLASRGGVAPGTVRHTREIGAALHEAWLGSPRQVELLKRGWSNSRVVVSRRARALPYHRSN
jgi:hypothetical protein